MNALEAVEDTDTWDSSHVKLLGAHKVDPETKREAKVEPRRLKLVEISSQGPEVVSAVPPRNFGPYSDTDRSESLTISEISMDSLLHSRQSLRLPPSNKTCSTSSLVSIPADVIVALRTASFSEAPSKDIEEMLQETEVVLRRKIPDGTKLVIRERYRAEGADKIAEQMLAENSTEHDRLSPGSTAACEPGISGDEELSPLQDSISSGENPSSILRRQWAAAFEETARVLSEIRLAASPSLSSGSKPSTRFDTDLVAGDLNYIFADAAKMYSLPMIAPKQKQHATTSEGASITDTNNDLIRDYKKK